jgi:hypothetical protein
MPCISPARLTPANAACTSQIESSPVGISEVSRPAEGFATGRDFASTGSGSPRPRNYIVSQQINVEVAIHYRRRLRNRGIRSGKAKPRTNVVRFLLRKMRARKRNLAADATLSSLN